VKTQSEPPGILCELSATVLPNPHLEAVANGTLSDSPPPVDTRRSRPPLGRAGDRLHIAAYGNVSAQTFGAFNTPTLSWPKTSLRATQAQPGVRERPNGAAAQDEVIGHDEFRAVRSLHRSPGSLQVEKILGGVARLP